MSIAGNTPEDVERRRIQACKMRLRGMSYHRIAAALGVSISQIYKDVMWEARKRAEEFRETVEEVRQMEVERLDVILDRLWDRIDTDNPSLDHLEAFFKVSTRRAKLLGLDAAGKSEVTIRDGRPEHTPDADLYKRVRELQERLARLPGATPNPILLERNPFDAAKEPAIEAEVVTVVKEVAPTDHSPTPKSQAKGQESGPGGARVDNPGSDLDVDELEEGREGARGHANEPLADNGVLLEGNPDGTEPQS